MAGTALSPGLLTSVDVLMESIGGADSPKLRIDATDSEFRIVRRIFNEFDEDKSGSIDMSELDKVMIAMGFNLTPDQLSVLLKEVDVSESGSLDFDQFLRLIQLWRCASQFKLFDTPSQIQEDRIRQALSNSVWLPDDYLRSAWDVMVVLFLLYSWITILYGVTLSNYHDYFESLLVPDILCAIVFAADICFCLNTSVLDESSRLVTSRREIAMAYACRSLLIDIFAVIPYQHFGTSPAVTALTLLRLLKIIKLPWYFAPTGHYRFTPRYVQCYFFLLPLFRLLVYFIACLHALAVVFMFIHGSDELSRLAVADGENKGVVIADNSYITALYFIFYTLTTCGLGNVLLLKDGEKLFACFLFVLALLVNGLIIGNVVTIMQRTDVESERKAKLRQTLAVCQYFKVPQTLETEILQFQSHVLSNHLSTAYEDLIQALPLEMKANINLHVKISLLDRVPLFSSTHQGCKVALAQQLSSRIMHPEEYVAIAGEEDRGDLYLTSYGFLDVLNFTGYSERVLKRGDYFGLENVLSASRVRVNSLKALSYCELLVLGREALRDVMAHFPRFEIAVAATRRDLALELRDHPSRMGASTIRNPLTASLNDSLSEMRRGRAENFLTLTERCVYRLNQMERVMDSLRK